MLSTWVDFLATRIGFCVAMCLVCLATLAAGGGFHRAASGIQETQIALENHRSGKANAALSDLLRLTIILHDARLAGFASAETEGEFSAALDIIHVRAEHIRTRLERFGKNDPAHAGDTVEQFADTEPFDAVVCSLVLCSVDDPEAVVAQLFSLLKPGGQLRYLEHVAGAGARGGLQRVADATVWPRLLGNCHTHRDTEATIVAAGFVITGGRHEWTVPAWVPLPVAEFAIGVASRPS